MKIKIIHLIILSDLLLSAIIVMYNIFNIIFPDDPTILQIK